MGDNTSTVGSVCRSYTLRFGFLPFPCCDRESLEYPMLYSDNKVPIRVCSLKRQTTSSGCVMPILIPPTNEFKFLSTPISSNPKATDAIHRKTYRCYWPVETVSGGGPETGVEGVEEISCTGGEEDEVRKTIGDVGTAFVVADVGSGVVLRAAGAGNLD